MREMFIVTAYQYASFLEVSIYNNMVDLFPLYFYSYKFSFTAHLKA